MFTDLLDRINTRFPWSAPAFWLALSLFVATDGIVGAFKRRAEIAVGSWGHGITVAGTAAIVVGSIYGIVGLYIAYLSARSLIRRVRGEDDDSD